MINPYMRNFMINEWLILITKFYSLSLRMYHRKSILYHLHIIDSENYNEEIEDYDC